MKSLRDYISESEIRLDYDNIMEIPTIDNKLRIMEKYGIKSKKILDIKVSLLDFIRESRCEKTSYDDEDIKYFLRLTNGFPTIYKRVYEMLSKEKPEFVNFLFEKYQLLVSNRKLEGKSSNDKKLGVLDRFLLKCYENIEKFIQENLNKL